MTARAHRPFAVVTGGSNSVGYELAAQVVDNGHDVLVAAETEAGLEEEAAARLGASGATALAIAVALPDKAAAAVHRTLSKPGSA